MDAYLVYNQINMDPIDAHNTTFMSNHNNFYYNVLPYGPKNVGTNYQKLMDAVFSKKIGNNLEVYIDDVIVKTSEGENHATDL